MYSYYMIGEVNENIGLVWVCIVWQKKWWNQLLLKAELIINKGEWKLFYGRSDDWIVFENSETNNWDNVVFKRYHLIIFKDDETAEWVFTFRSFLLFSIFNLLLLLRTIQQVSSFFFEYCAKRPRATIQLEWQKSFKNWKHLIFLILLVVF